VIAAVAAAAAAFNLVCAGNTIFGADWKHKTAFEITLRVDLQSGRWCSHACKETQRIYGLSATQIVFEAEDSSGSGTLNMVNRESGAYIFRIREDMGKVPIISQIGVCRRAPFSGFPRQQF